MVIDQINFKRILYGKSMYRHLKKSKLPLRDGDFPPEQKRFVDTLYEDVRAGRYFPSIPRGYIVQDKSRGVSRIIPVLNVTDSCLYYYCLKYLEDFLAINRVPGTWGGWRLGNPMRRHEDSERESLQGMGDFYLGSGSYYPARWIKNWTEYQNLAHLKSRQYHLHHSILFDVSNFYDSVNLETLERKVRSAVPVSHSETVDLLFILLRNWNRALGGYGPRSVGLPQDDIGDCSRILANFYLQDYDQIMHQLCIKTEGGGEYLRYADDQIVMTKNRQDGQMILFHASSALHRIGLNINTSKVKEIASRDDFAYFWGFDIFRRLEQPECYRDGSLEVALRIDADRSNPAPLPWRRASVLRRLVTIGLHQLDPAARSTILSEILSLDFLRTATAEQMSRIKSTITESERETMLQILESLIPLVPHNSFHLELMRFYGDNFPSAFRAISGRVIERTSQMLQYPV